jgi:hypothetical protein
MWQTKTYGVALALAMATSAWAGGVEPYPDAVVGQSVSTKTRAEVVAQLHDAIRSGQMYDLYDGWLANAKETGQASDETQVAAQMANDPDGTFIVWGNAALMRTRIQAEAAEANRLGLISVGEGDPPVATAEQEQLIAAAGRAATERYWVVGSR